jgi:hypothetical protein
MNQTTNQPTHLLTPWCRVFLKKVIVIQLVTKFPVFVEPCGLLLSSQEATTGP